MKSFHSGVICAPKTPNLEGVKQAPHSEQATGQGMHYRDILFTPRCSPRAREGIFEVGQLFVRRTVAELRGVKISQFSDFGPFSSYKTPKKYLSVTSIQPYGLHRRMIPTFPCHSSSGRGAVDRRNLPKLSPMANGYTHTKCHYTARQIWTKDI